MYTHGISAPMKFDITDLATANVRARYETKEEIDAKGRLEVTGEQLLLFFYANRDENEPLWCPAGMPKARVIDSFYYAVFVSVVAVD